MGFIVATLVPAFFWMRRSCTCPAPLLSFFLLGLIRFPSAALLVMFDFPFQELIERAHSFLTLAGASFPVAFFFFFFSRIGAGLRPRIDADSG